MTPDRTIEHIQPPVSGEGNKERGITPGDSAHRGNKLLIDIGNNLFAIEATMVAAIVETERFFLLPQISSLEKTGLIKGVVTRRGEVVVVIDFWSLFGMPSMPDEKPYRIIIVKKDGLHLGIYVGKKELFFLWEEELKNLEFKPGEEQYILGLIDPLGKNIRLIDWQKIFEEAQKCLEFGDRSGGRGKTIPAPHLPSPAS